MHESSLARAILREVLLRATLDGGDASRGDLASSGRATRVVSVRGWVAETETLSVDSLRTMFEQMAKGTLADGASLDLAVTHVKARCSNCETEYLPNHHIFFCPKCGGTSAELCGKTGLGIESLEVID